MKKATKLISLVSALLIGQMLVGVAFAVQDSPTMGSIEQDLTEYLEANHPELEPRSPEYVSYLVDVLMEDADPGLAALPNYDDIQYFAGEYLYQLDLWQASGSATDDATFTLPKSYKAKTIDTVQKEVYAQQTQEDQLYAEATDSIIKTPDASINYNQDNSTAYALKYATSYNSNYATHSKDCTNFVSQCLHAGGFAMKKPSSPAIGITNTTKYWYSIKYQEWHTNSYVNRWKETSSWIGVADFYKYCVSKGAKIITCNTLKSLQNTAKVGDIVQLKKSGGSWYHSIIISSGTKGNLNYCGHTSNRKNYPVSKITGSVQYRIIRF
jgi:hypothetical protein